MARAKLFCVDAALVDWPVLRSSTGEFSARGFPLRAMPACAYSLG